MKKLIIALLGLALLAPTAYAAIGYLRQCSIKITNRGNRVWVGVYDVQGQMTVQYFSDDYYDYCPQTLEFESIF